MLLEPNEKLERTIQSISQPINQSNNF